MTTLARGHESRKESQMRPAFEHKLREPCADESIAALQYQLQAMLVAHAQWLRMELAFGTRFSLSGASAIGIRLETANLRKAAITTTDLRGACLHGADLSESELYGS